MMHKTETSGDDAAEEWSTSVNWEDPAIKAKRRRRLNPVMQRKIRVQINLCDYNNWFHWCRYGRAFDLSHKTDLLYWNWNTTLKL